MLKAKALANVHIRTTTTCPCLHTSMILSKDRCSGWEYPEANL